jgi:Fur family ferric uptake transcriptional regulator
MLRAAGLRVTAMRTDILAVLTRSSRALTAAEVLEELSRPPHEGAKAHKRPAGTSHRRAAAHDKVTVYRTLNTLVESNLAHKVDPGDRVFRYSLTDHARCSHERHDHEHPHVVCDSCGTVECLDDAEVIVRSRNPASDPKGAPGGKAIGASRSRLTRFRITRQEITLRGTCERCDQLTGRTGSAPGDR